jgi:hypothetical protein
MVSRVAKPTRTVVHAGKEEGEGKGEVEGMSLDGVSLSLSPSLNSSTSQQGKRQTANGKRQTGENN